MRTDHYMSVRDNAWAVLLGVLGGYAVAFYLLDGTGRVALTLGVVFGALFVYAVWMFEHASDLEEERPRRDTNDRTGAP